MQCQPYVWADLAVTKHTTIQIAIMVVQTHILHTVTCDTSNGRTVAGTNGTAGNGALSYTGLSSIAVHAVNNNWYITRTKPRSIDGITSYKRQQVIRSNSSTRSTVMYKL